MGDGTYTLCLDFVGTGIAPLSPSGKGQAASNFTCYRYFNFAVAGPFVYHIHISLPFSLFSKLLHCDLPINILYQGKKFWQGESHSVPLSGKAMSVLTVTQEQ